VCARGHAVNASLGICGGIYVCLKTQFRVYLSEALVFPNCSALLLVVFEKSLGGVKCNRSRLHFR